MYKTEVRTAIIAHLDAVKKEALPFEQQLGKFLFEEAEGIISSLAYEYLWFRFLREHIGIAMVEPAKVNAASLLQPDLDNSNPTYEQYGIAFYEWLRKLVETDQLDDFYYKGTGVLTAQLALFRRQRQGYKKFGVRFVAVDDTMLDGDEGAEGEEVGLAEGESIIDSCEQLRGLESNLADYARSGYAPVIQYPVSITPTGYWRNAYVPAVKKFYHLNLAEFYASTEGDTVVA